MGIRTSLEKNEQNKANNHEIIRLDDFTADVVEEWPVWVGGRVGRGQRWFGKVGEEEDAQTRDLLNKLITMIETTSRH
jgi:hypothetical protein